MDKPLFKIESIAGTPFDTSRFMDPPQVETIKIPQTMEATIDMDITPEFISALIDAGLLETAPTKQPDGTVSNEILIVDPEWPNIIG